MLWYQSLIYRFKGLCINMKLYQGFFGGPGWILKLILKGPFFNKWYAKYDKHMQQRLDKIYIFFMNYFSFSTSYISAINWSNHLKYYYNTTFNILYVKLYIVLLCKFSNGKYWYNMEWYLCLGIGFIKNAPSASRSNLLVFVLPSGRQMLLSNSIFLHQNSIEYFVKHFGFWAPVI